MEPNILQWMTATAAEHGPSEVWPYEFVYGVLLVVCGAFLSVTLTTRSRRLVWLSLAVVFAVVAAAVFFLKGELQREAAKEKEREEALIGVLKPGDVDYETEHNLLVLLGTNAVATSEDRQIVVEAGDDPLLEVRREEDGSLAIYASLYTLDGVQAARIDGNQILIDDPRFRFARPDYHSIVVVDHTGQVMLSLAFLNEHVVKAAGYFTAPGCKALVINPSNPRTPQSNVAIGARVGFTLPCGG